MLGSAWKKTLWYVGLGSSENPAPPTPTQTSATTSTTSQSPTALTTSESTTIAPTTTLSTSPLISAGDDVSKINDLLTSTPEIHDTDIQKVFIHDATHGYANALSVLLEKRADAVSPMLGAALSIATQNHHEAVVAILMKCEKVTPDDKIFAATTAAVLSPDLPTLNVVLEDSTTANNLATNPAFLALAKMLENNIPTYKPIAYRLGELPVLNTIPEHRANPILLFANAHKITKTETDSATTSDASSSATNDELNGAGTKRKRSGNE